MKNYKLQVEIKIVECDEPEMSEPLALPEVANLISLFLLSQLPIAPEDMQFLFSNQC